MNEFTCNTCPHWDTTQTDYPEFGWCRAHPPQVLGGDMWAWPETGELDWCNEHPGRRAEVPQAHFSSWSPDFGRGGG
jgi:hypothetical protein